MVCSVILCTLLQRNALQALHGGTGAQPQGVAALGPSISRLSLYNLPFSTYTILHYTIPLTILTLTARYATR